MTVLRQQAAYIRQLEDERRRFRELVVEAAMLLAYGIPLDGDHARRSDWLKRAHVALYGKEE